MKIAFISPGNTSHEKSIVRKAIQRGHEVTLISTRYENPHFSETGAEFIYYDPPVSRLRIIPVVLHLRRILRQLQPDLMLSSIPPIYGFIASLTGFHPHIAMPWGTDILHLPNTSWILRQKARFALHNADVVLCPSSELQGVARSLASGPASKYPILQLSNVDCEVFKPAPSSLRDDLGWKDKCVLIMARSFHPAIYGVEFFIEALPLVMKKAPETRVIMVGSGSLDQELRARVIELGLRDVVHFTGRVDHDDMPSYFNAADIYVSMSMSDATSVSLLEAMACSLPVVLSDIPDNRDWVVPGENGLLVNVGDYSLISKAVSQHLRNHRNLWNYSNSTSREYPIPVSSAFPQDIASALVSLIRNSKTRRKMGQQNLKIVRERADLNAQFVEFELIARRLIDS